MWMIQTSSVWIDGVGRWMRWSSESEDDEDGHAHAGRTCTFFVVILVADTRYSLSPASYSHYHHLRWQDQSPADGGWPLTKELQIVLSWTNAKYSQLCVLSCLPTTVTECAHLYRT